MNTKNIINDKDLAELIISKAEKEDIIVAVFDYFEFDCMLRCNVNPDLLDKKIDEFENSGYCDVKTLSEIIGLIKNGKETFKKSEDVLFKEIKQYIAENFTADLTVYDIAEYFHISYYYMCHFFKKRCGVTVNEFKNQKRLEKAVKKLLKSNDKIGNIATECGFNSLSYFTEYFNTVFKISPTDFRKKYKDTVIHEFYDLNDIFLAMNMPSKRFLSKNLTDVEFKFTVQDICVPDEEFAFLHEAAIIEYKGVLYASWYNCPKGELQGYTPIREKRSYDGGKTWSKAKTIVGDFSGKILYCPPVYGIDNGKLYMFINQMVAPDHIHSVDLYRLNEETKEWEMCWSKPIPFKLNTNVISLKNGKLILPGRTGNLDGFPNTPAVLISDSGKIDANWRIVKVAPNGDLPDGSKLVHPETTIICVNDALYLFNRNDQRKVPLVYISYDFGESWSNNISHDIPYVNSKIYAGTLSNGRHFLIADVDNFCRNKLAIYFTESDEPIFEKRIVLFNTEKEFWGACHYPAVCEYDNKLYIIATKGTEKGRGAVLFTLDLTKFNK